jgi:uncharacterized protein
MIVKCPGCGKETETKGNPFRPFCSKRCKLIDLGRWISGDYRIPTKSADEDEEGKPKTGNNSDRHS